MNLFVSNLSFRVEADALAQLFGQYGDVQRAHIVKDKETGRSRGFGFVEMADKATGENAIKALNGQDFEGRPLVVNEARPREQQSRPRR
ncbi:RNA recognition motif domain-containing protein [Gallaecimonas xiamenensis]|uniref:RNA recognition motif-containing protein n=1 Tax=Gallaecimonas xiamenensis 3-C-1 TaxID=745411 RepID=K2JF45_9GAMM|nr:RNA-binding protein [Gallaecimonas xiamenensis]EKE73698.1 RNA recognition motif-containing protein [Gallaecimonas xiamenensis 3-C-1]